MANLQDVLLSGTRAGQPAATAVAEGTLYFVTDEEVTEQSDGAAWDPYSATVLLDRVGQLDIVNTAAETSIYSYSVVGGTLGATNTLHLLMDGDQLNNAGAGNDTVTLKIKYGATTMYSDTALYASNATRISWRMDIRLGNTTGTSAQYVSVQFLTSTRGGATTGNGDFNANGTQYAILSGTAAEDSTATKTFDVTIQHSLTDATVSWRRQYASLVKE